MRTLVVFLSWRVKVKKEKRLEASLDLLQELSMRLSKQKKATTDPQKKAQRIQSLPRVPDFLAWIHGDLHVDLMAAKQAYERSGEAGWEYYAAFRNYFLVVMLFAVPPQRKQIFEQMTLEHVKFQGDITVLQMKNHKTAHHYGDLVIMLPSRFGQDFKLYLKLRAIIAPSCGSLFIGKDSKMDGHLTNKFQELVYKKFDKIVSIRDCRSIYITHASQHLGLKELYALSRQTMHSFETQQHVYLFFYDP